MKKIFLLFSALFFLSSGVNPPIHGNYKGRQLVFDGNSLTNLGSNSLILNGFYYAGKTYDSLVTHGVKLSYQNYSISGRAQITLNSEYPTKIAPNVKPNDILVIWEIINDATISMITPQTMYDHLYDYCVLARASGLKIIVLTGTAISDSTRFSKISLCNALIRANPPPCDAVCDVAALPQFDARSDASSAIYYAGDGVHLSNIGYDQIKHALYPNIITVMALP